jgi:hypothetical protein
MFKMFSILCRFSSILTASEENLLVSVNAYSIVNCVGNLNEPIKELESTALKG